MRTTNRQIVKIAPALLFWAIILVHHIPEARADISAQDKEVLEAVDKVAPTVEEIAKKFGTCPKFHSSKSSHPLISRTC